MAGEWSMVDEFLAQAQPPADGRAAFMGALEADIATNKADRRAAQRTARAQRNLSTGMGRMRSIPGVAPTLSADARLGYYDPRAVAALQQQFAPAQPPLALGTGTPGGAIIPATARDVATIPQRALPAAPQQLALTAGQQALGPGPAAIVPGPAPLPAAPLPNPRGFAPPTGAPFAPRAPLAAAAGVTDDILAKAAGLASIPNVAGSAPAAAALGRGATALNNLRGLGSLRGLAAGGARALPLAGAGMVAGQVSSALWDDSDTTLDEGLTGALTGAGMGAGVGSMILPGIGTGIGAGLGALVGGGIGLFGPKNTGDNAVQSEFGKLTTKMNDQFDQLNVPDEVRQSIYEQINMAVTLNAKSKDDVKAIFQQGTANLPQLLADHQATTQQSSRLAAIQAAILPLMEKSSQANVASAQRSQSWLNQAASYQPDPQVAALLRSQGETLMTNANANNTAAYGQIAAAPLLRELMGAAPQLTTQGGVPASDTAALIQQLGLG